MNILGDLVTSVTLVVWLLPEGSTDGVCLSLSVMGTWEVHSLLSEHPMQTHVSALFTCTMTSLDSTVASLGGF
jgi:hypothetical protein